MLCHMCAGGRGVNIYLRSFGAVLYQMRLTFLSPVVAVRDVLHLTSAQCWRFFSIFVLTSCCQNFIVKMHFLHLNSCSQKGHSFSVVLFLTSLFGAMIVADVLVYLQMHEIQKLRESSR
jgi:heme/copper-type cytochrome/quinol oxidase subunit 4